VGVTDVRVEGENVLGKWRDSLERYYDGKGRTVAERFANCKDEREHIVQFTRRFGPLTPDPGQQGPRLRSFTFSLESWRRNQWEFRKSWAGMQQHGGAEITQLLEMGHAEIQKGWLHFGCGSLWDFMTLELLGRLGKLRFCRRPGCAHPYFIAQHGKEQYCSTDCANWAQSKWKKQWHEAQRQKKLNTKRR
jgi:hypothetical protein